MRKDSLLDRSRLFFHIFAQLLLQFAVLLDRLADGHGKVRHIIEHGAQLADGILRKIELRLGTLGRHCFDTAYSGRDRTLVHDVHRTDHPGLRYMRTATQFNGRSVTDYTHFVAIFLAEERHCAHRFSLRDRDIAIFLQRQIFTYLPVDRPFDLADFLICQFPEVGEIETQRFGRHV